MCVCVHIFPLTSLDRSRCYTDGTNDGSNRQSHTSPVGCRAMAQRTNNASLRGGVRYVIVCIPESHLCHYFNKVFIDHLTSCVMQQVSKSCADCEAAKMELSKLRTDYSSLTEHLEGVLATNEALRKSSLLLQERSATLLEELSVKEAEWSLREEKLQAAVRVLEYNQ